MRRGTYREAGAKFIVDVLSDEQTTREDGAVWRTARVRLVRVIRQSPIKELKIGHEWTCDMNLSVGAMVGWALDYPPPSTELDEPSSALT